MIKSARCVSPTAKGRPKSGAGLSSWRIFRASVHQLLFADFWLGETIANGPFVHYPNEKWFPLTEDDEVPEGLLDPRLRAFYDPDDQLTASMLVDLQSGNDERGVCGLPFTRQSDGETVYIPMNIVGNLYVSNGMSAGNTANEARVQALSEVFERHIKNRIIAESISLPEIPAEVMARYPGVVESINKLEAEGFPIFAYDGSLGGKYPVICVVLFNPTNGTCFASFGAHPDFGVALERTVTELLQGRSLKDLDVFTPLPSMTKKWPNTPILKPTLLIPAVLSPGICSNRMPTTRSSTGASPARRKKSSPP